MYKANVGPIRQTKRQQTPKKSTKYKGQFAKTIGKNGNEARKVMNKVIRKDALSQTTVETKTFI